MLIGFLGCLSLLFGGLLSVGVIGFFFFLWVFAIGSIDAIVAIDSIDLIGPFCFQTANLRNNLLSRSFFDKKSRGDSFK